MSRERFHVVTGGPGSGKTALIEALHAHGYARTVEAGRGIIQEQMLSGGRALPWDDRALFAEMMLSWKMRSYRMAEQSRGVVFFDRGVVDVLGYLRLCGLPEPEHVKQAVKEFRYSRQVFVAPPWREIFQQDSERKQDFAEAGRTYEVLVETYEECGYELTEIPKVTVEERLRFVRERIRGPELRPKSR